MEFVVGRKYRYKESNYAPIECIAIATTGHIIFQNTMTMSVFSIDPKRGDDYIEFHEPQTVTRWAYVYWDKGKLKTSYPAFPSELEAKSYFLNFYSPNDLALIIPVTYTENT